MPRRSRYLLVVVSCVSRARNSTFPGLQKKKKKKTHGTINNASRAPPTNLSLEDSAASARACRLLARPLFEDALLPLCRLATRPHRRSPCKPFWLLCAMSLRQRPSRSHSRSRIILIELGEAVQAVSKFGLNIFSIIWIFFSLCFVVFL